MSICVGMSNCIFIYVHIHIIKLNISIFEKLPIHNIYVYLERKTKYGKQR